MGGREGRRGGLREARHPYAIATSGRLEAESSSHAAAAAASMLDEIVEVAPPTCHGRDCRCVVPAAPPAPAPPPPKPEPAPAASTAAFAPSAAATTSSTASSSSSSSSGRFAALVIETRDKRLIARAPIEKGGKSTWLIGRSEGCDLSIKNSGKEVAEDEERAGKKGDVVSRKHAKLTLADGKLWIEDLGSQQGTLPMACKSRVGEGGRHRSSRLKPSQKEVVFEVPDAPSKVPTLSECVSFGKAKYLLCVRMEKAGAKITAPRSKGKAAVEEAEESIVLPSAPSKEELARARREAAEREEAEQQRNKLLERMPKKAEPTLPAGLGANRCVFQGTWVQHGTAVGRGVWTRSRRLLRRRLTSVWDRHWPS